MTQTAKTEIPAADVTAALLDELDTNTIVVVTPTGRRFGDKPSITWGLHNTWDGDYEGFAAWLREQD